MTVLGTSKVTLARLSLVEIREAILEHRGVIRSHRDQRGDDRCWLDDHSVWAMLEDTPPELTVLPLYDGMMSCCNDFFTYRQSPEPDPMPADAIHDPKHWDDDLAAMIADNLLDELVRLQEAIRRHRDIKDRQRTADDDRELYSILPEKIPADFRLPPREEFLGGVRPGAGCPNFWRSHQGCSVGQHNLHNWGPCRKT